MFWGCLFALLSCTSSPMLPLSRKFKVIWVAFPSVTSGVNGVEDAAEDDVKVMDNCPVRPWELGKTWGKSVVLQLPSTSYFLHVFCHEKKKTGHGFGGTHCDHWNAEDVHLILRGKNLSHLRKRWNSRCGSQPHPKHPMVVSEQSLFLQWKNDYPPGNTNISPTSRHLWVDVPNFPFGGSKQEFPGVTSSPSIKSNTGSSRRTIW